MSTALNFKDIIDIPKWRQMSTGVNIPSVANSSGIFSDWRNNEDRYPFLINCAGIALYNVKQDSWINTGLAFTGQTNAFFMPAQGPRGTITTTGTNSSFTLSTVLPATVGVNQLANRGDGRGFKVRIIGNSAGSSGKTEERYIIANTSGTTPLVNVDIPFSFIPATGDAYEFLSGRLFSIGNSAVAGQFKYYDVLTNSLSGNLSVVNLVLSTTDNAIVGLDELLVPYDRSPGEGFKGLLTATASGAASITGQVAGGDSTVVTNEHRNFQIRIVNDTGTPTAAGQRRNITSHTAGPSPVYTVPAWSVQPSANAQYVIENNGDRIIVWASTSTQTSTYSVSGNAWDASVTFAVRPNAGSCLAVQSFAIEPDVASNARHSFIYAPRGALMDLFDIAGAATGLWTSGITYNPTVNIGSNFAITYDTATNQGRYAYISTGVSNAFYRFDVLNRVMESVTNIKLGNLQINSPEKNLSHTTFIDGNTKMAFIYTVFTGATALTPTTFLQLPIIR